MTKTEPMPYLQHEAMEDSITFLIHKVSLSYAAQSARITKRLNGLGLAEWRVLFCLAHWGDSAPIDIARRIGLDKSQISKTIAALVRKTFVSLRSDPNDLRYKLVAMTPAGIAAYNDVVPVFRRRRAAMLDGLSQDDIDVVRAALKVMSRRIPELEAEVMAQVDAAKADGATAPDGWREGEDATS